MVGPTVIIGRWAPGLCGFVLAVCEHRFVRWDNLEEGVSTQGRLAGLGESVVRTFDAPEALGIRFHEVKARSALNSVPKQSRMPFRWTINPYRGCTHACVLSIASRGPRTPIST